MRMQEASLETDWRMGAMPGSAGVTFRVWAPQARQVDVAIGSGAARGQKRLAAQPDGFFSALVPGARSGDRYRFSIDGGDALPDPASRFQPEGPHGPSEVIDTRQFAWSDRHWPGIDTRNAVLYELHIGTFTAQGTWQGAMQELPRLAKLGINTLEIMPIAEFPGRFGWGYDGVNMFAPYHVYGRPHDVCAFVDAAHRLGIGVILDVVYNHFGPDGNYLPAFTRDWLGQHASEWGDAPNFDGRNCRAVREFYLDNVAYWIGDFHFDGLRFDATQQIYDSSDEHILRAMVRRGRAAAGARRTYFIAENQGQHAHIAQPEGVGCDGLWNDDFHHAALVALTGRREAYYSDYRGTPQELVSAVRHGFLYQGQWSAWIKQPHGTPAQSLEPCAFVNYLENHDQVANSAHGARLMQIGDPGRVRALTALLLLAPQTPLLFQGQEYASTRPFLYFADHHGDLADAVRTGRAQFLAQFPSIASEAVRSRLADPSTLTTFHASRLDATERDSPRGLAALALFEDLLRLRREDAVLSKAASLRRDGAVLAEEAFLIRWFGERDDDRLLLVNLGRDLLLETIAEPLLAPPRGMQWRLAWSSEDLRYGGGGRCETDRACGLQMTAHSAALLVPQPVSNPTKEVGAP
jgi:maltooligosyltrehalose trehalohydrolase